MSKVIEEAKCWLDLASKDSDVYKSFEYEEWMEKADERWCKEVGIVYKDWPKIFVSITRDVWRAGYLNGNFQLMDDDSNVITEVPWSKEKELVEWIKQGIALGI